MLDNLISNLYHYTTPKVREVNTKASVKTNSNSFREMFMTFSAFQHYKPVRLLVRICSLRPEFLDRRTDWSTYMECRAIFCNTYLHFPWEKCEKPKNRKTAYYYKLEVEWQP